MLAVHFSKGKGVEKEINFSQPELLRLIHQVEVYQIELELVNTDQIQTQEENKFIAD